MPILSPSTSNCNDLRIYWVLRYATISMLLMAIFGNVSPAHAQLRVADNVRENFVPQRNVSNTCVADVRVVSDGDIDANAGYCPFGGQRTHRITLEYDNPSALESFDGIILFVNSGSIFSDLELSIFDLEVDYLDDNGNETRLRMRNVTLPDTLNANDPQTVLFRLDDGAGDAVILRGVSEVRIRNLRNNLQNNGEIPVREIQLRQIASPDLMVELGVSKTSEIFDPNGLGLFSIPGNDVLYRIRVSNLADAPDRDTINIIDIFPTDLEFFNGDANGVLAGTNAINFTESNSGLSFDINNDAAFSDSNTAPQNFADCNYSPIAGYDPNVRFICLQPKGQFNAASPPPFIEFTFRARIK